MWNFCYASLIVIDCPVAAGIMEFTAGNKSFPCSLFFCLGEKWPDPDNRPWEKKLITIEVRELLND